MLQNSQKRLEWQLSAFPGAPRRWVISIGLAIAVGVAYFLSARLSLVLLTKPDGVAVFWPAAGVAAGVLIALGLAARLPVVAGGFDRILLRFDLQPRPVAPCAGTACGGDRGDRGLGDRRDRGLCIFP